MEFLVNDLSLAGQFHEGGGFGEAVDRLMQIRREILRLGSDFYCSRRLAQAQVAPGAVMQQAVNWLPMAKRQAWVQWLTRLGPYWEDDAVHSSDTWLESQGAVVTDSSVGEAAACQWEGRLRELVSFSPSQWLHSPIQVIHCLDDGRQTVCDLTNHWDLPTVRATLAKNPPVITSWEDLAAKSLLACTHLNLAVNAFHPLRGHPFRPAAAERIRILLHTLDKMKTCFDENGQRSAEGSELFTDRFCGDNAWFSDSSEPEKRDFVHDLTFRHPLDAGETLFCTWHGKVRGNDPIRVHFSWPITATNALYVVYVGPKITKR